MVERPAQTLRESQTVSERVPVDDELNSRSVVPSDQEKVEIYGHSDQTATPSADDKNGRLQDRKLDQDIGDNDC